MSFIKRNKLTMAHVNHVHVAKELLKPDLSTAESVVKQGLFMKTSQIIWHADIRLRQKRHGPALIASRTHCVPSWVIIKCNGIQKSHICFYCRSDYMARLRHRLKTLITELRLGRRLCPTCWCNCLRNIPTSSGSSPPSQEQVWPTEASSGCSRVGCYLFTHA